MGTVLYWIVGIVVAGASIYWWFFVGKREARFRQRVARRFDVTIETTWDGMWDVEAPNRSWFARVGIEMLQLAYWMGALLVWSVWMLAFAALMLWLERA